MFLNQLNENQKELFLSLCGHAIMADGIVELEEMESLALYCYEMMIPNHLPDTSESAEEIIEQLAAVSSEQEKHIIVFELIMLFKNDGKYDETERTFMQVVLDKLGVSTEKHDQLEALADRYNALYGEICTAVNA